MLGAKTQNMACCQCPELFVGSLFSSLDAGHTGGAAYPNISAGDSARQRSTGGNKTWIPRVQEAIKSFGGPSEQCQPETGWFDFGVQEALKSFGGPSEQCQPETGWFDFGVQEALKSFGGPSEQCQPETGWFYLGEATFTWLKWNEPKSRHATVTNPII
ncbi:hypothetical protein CC79DRAFT_1368777 [Sarocladium strictum]